MTTAAPDERGLPVAGAVVVALVLAGGAGAYDVVTGAGLGRVFAAGLAAGSVAAALVVRRDRLKAAVVLPPLVHLAVAAAAALAAPSGAGGRWYISAALQTAGTLVLQAPYLLVATGAALGVAVLRAALRR